MADVRLEFHADITKSTEALTAELDKIIQDVEKKISPIKLKFDTTEIKATIESVQSTIKETTARASQIITPNSATYNNALKSLKDDLASVIQKQRDWSVSSRDSSEAVSGAYKSLQQQEQVIREMIASLDGLKAANNTVTISVADFREQQSRYREAIASTSAVLEEASKKGKLLSQSMNPDAYADALSKVDDLMRKLKAARDTATSSNYAQQSPAGMRDLQYYIEQLDILRTKVVAETMSTKEFAASLKEISASSKSVTASISDYAKSLEQTKNASIISGTSKYSDVLTTLQNKLESVNKMITEWSGASVHESDAVRSAYENLIKQRDAIQLAIAELDKYKGTTGIVAAEVDKLNTQLAVFKETIQSSSTVIGAADAKSSLLSANTAAYSKAASDIERLMRVLTKAQETAASVDLGYFKPDMVQNLQGYIDRLVELKGQLESGNAVQNVFSQILSEISNNAGVVVGNIDAYAEEIKRAAKEAEAFQRANIISGTDDFDKRLKSLSRDLGIVTEQLTAWDSASVNQKEGAQQAYKNIVAQKEAIEELIAALKKYEDTNGEVVMSVEEFDRKQAEYSRILQESSTTIKQLGLDSKLLRDGLFNPTEFAQAKSDLSALADTLTKVQEIATRTNYGQVSPEGASNLQQYIERLNELRANLESGSMPQAEFASRLKEISALSKPVITEIKNYAAALEEARKSELRPGSTEFSKRLRELNRDFETVTEQLTKWNYAITHNEEAARNAYASLEAQQTRIQEIITTLNNAQQNNQALSIEEVAKAIAEYQAEMQKASTTLTEFDAKRKLLVADMNSSDYVQAISKVAELRRQIDSAMTAVKIDPTNTGAADLTRYSESLDALKSRLESGKMSVEGFNDEIKRISAGAKTAISAVNEYAERTRAFNENMDKSNELMMKAVQTQAKYASMGNSGNQYYDGLTKNIANLTMLSQKLKEGEISEQEFRTAVDDVTKSIEINTTGLQNSATGLQRIGQQIGGLFSGFTNFGNGLTQYITMMFSAYRIIYQVINGVKNLINRSIELEDVMVDLRIVTGLTNDEYTQYLHNISEVSKETATSLDSLITATTTFSRLGYSIEESSVLAKYTGMLEKVGSIDSARAQEAITSIMKAFSDELGVGNIEQVMDKLVAVGNNFPISVEQVSEGMLNASSALAAAGNSFEESVALLTAANTTIQNASKSSTGLRTIAARLRNTKSELDALGEEVLTKAKYDEIVQALTKYKVSLTDLNGEYRSTYDIIQDIANIWGDLSSMEQAALATEISGTRQQAVFFSLVEQFQEASGAMDKMASSADTLKDAYSAYTDSMSAHIEQFHTAWSQLAIDLVSSDLVKGIVDIGTSIVGVIDEMSRAKVLLTSILAVVAALQANRLVNIIAKSQQGLLGIVATLRATKTVTDSVSMSVASLNSSERSRLVTMLQEEVAQNRLTAEEYASITANLGLASAHGTAAGAANAQTTANIGLAASFQALWASNPIGLIMTVASALGVIVSLIPGIKEFLGIDSGNVEETLSETADSLAEVSESMEKLYSDTQKTTASMKDAIPRFAELARGVDRFGRNVSLSESEYEEFVDIQNQIAETFKELDAGLDSNGNHMLALQISSENLTEQLEKQLEAQRRLAQEELSAGLDSAYKTGAHVHSGGGHRRDDTPKIVGGGHHRDGVAGIVQHNTFSQEAVEQIRQVALQWAQMTPEYEAIGAQFGEGLQRVISNAILNLDANSLPTSEAMKNYIKKNMLNVFLELKPEAKNAIESFMDIDASFQSGETKAWDYRAAVITLEYALRAAGVEANTVQTILNGFEADDFSAKIETVMEGVTGSAIDTVEYLKTLSADELTIVYNIISANGSMSLDELKLKVEQVRLETGGLVDTLDMTEFFEKTKNLRSGMETIATAMKKLTEGTALTKSEMMKLAEQFPMLLKQSNLFTDGSIEGQKKMLKSVQDVQKKAYQAVVDAKVAELKASKEAINSQIDLEKKKVEVLLEAETALIKDKLEGNIKYERAMAKIDEIEATNFAEIKNGEVLVNNQGLQAMADSTAQTSEQLLGNVWIPYAEGMITTIGGAYETMVDAAKDAYEAITEAITSGDTDVGVSSAVMLARAASGDKEALDNLRNGIWTLSNKSAEIFKNSMNRQISLGRIKVLEGAVIDIDNIIANLEASLEDLTYTFSDASASMGSSSGSSSSSYSSSSNDPESRYNSAIEALIAYRVKMFRAELEAQKKELENQKSLAKKFYDYQKSLVDRQYKEDKYRKEQEEKRKDITDIQMEMDRLQKDNSAWAQGRLVELAEKLTEAQDKLEEFEEKEAVEFWKGYWDDMYKAEEDRIAGEVQSINDILSDNTDFYQRAYSELRSGTTKFANTIFEYAQKNETSMDSFYKMFSNVYDALLALQKEDNRTIYGDGTSWWWTGDGLRWLYDLITNPYNYPFSGAKYASGTSYATPGWHRVNEVGAEMLFTSADGKQYRLFSGGERVLDADSTSFLYALAKTKGGSLAGAISQSYRNVTARTTPTNITMGNIIINGNADERTVSEIRRAQRDSVSALLREFTRLAR